MSVLALSIVAAFQLAGPVVPVGAAVAGPATPSPSVTYVGLSGDLVVPAPLRPSVQVRVDGRIDEAEWATAPLLTGFTQYDPVEGVAAAMRTEVRVLVTSDALYFAVKAFDEPETVRATLARRDDFGDSDDYIQIVLDTFDDQRRAYVFRVNPLGVQGDGLWVEGRGGRGDPVDWSPDFVWSSEGRIDPDGYTVELSIPLKSLRFPDRPVQDWGLQVTRQTQRNGFSDAWAPVTSEEVNRLAQAGKLSGLRDLQRGMFLEINPVLTGSSSAQWGGEDVGLVRDPSSGQFGFNATYGLTSNLTLDGTFNPDFSQVEADAGQITVNERFAIRLSEQRPFFLEGTDVFNMPQQLVYTRSIGNPVAAAKLSGKVGAWNVAYLGAVDRASDGSDPVVNLLRAKRDLGSSHSVGLVYTDRTASGNGFNRLVGADGRFVFRSRYTVELLAAGSADAIAASPSTRWGSLLSASLRRSSRTFTYSASFEDVTNDFRAGSGFIRRVGVTEAQARMGYTFRGSQGAFVERWGPSIEAQGTWSHDGFWSGRASEENQLSLNLSASLRNNIGGFISWSRDNYNIGAEAYEGFAVAGNGGTAAFLPDQRLFQGLDAVQFRTWMSPWEKVDASFGASWNESPVFDRGAPVDLADRWSADVGLTLRPSGSLSTEIGVRHVTLLRKRDASTYSSATIPRIRTRYQFSRSLFVRAIGEYSSQERGDVLDPVSGSPILFCRDACSPRAGSDNHDFRLEGLLGYEPSPGTVVYVGYTRSWQDTLGFRFQDLSARSDGLFVKLSYRFRM